MTMIRATFYDGKTSQGTPVEIHLESQDRLRFTGLDRDLAYALSDVRIASRVGNTPRCIHLPGGAMCETHENDAIDAVLRRQGRGSWQAFLHKLESKSGYVLLSLVLTVASVWGVVEYGIPSLARRVAHALPASTDAALGREGLKVLDRVLFSPSTLAEKRQSQLRSLFDDMTQRLADVHDFRLEFRKSDRVGPNAFAFPLRHHRRHRWPGLARRTSKRAHSRPCSRNRPM